MKIGTKKLVQKMVYKRRKKLKSQKII